MQRSNRAEGEEERSQLFETTWLMVRFTKNLTRRANLQHYRILQQNYYD